MTFRTYTAAQAIRIASNILRASLILLVLLSSERMAKAQVAVSLSPTPCPTFYSNTGALLSAGKVFTFAAGTSTPQASYTDSTGTVANPNPIVLSGGGQPLSPSGSCGIWLSQTAYRIVVQNSAGTQQWTVDGVNAWSVLSLANAWTSLQTFNGGAAGFFQGTAANQASSGVFRMATGDQFCWRNFGNSGNICVIKNSSDNLVFPTSIAVTNAVSGSTFTGPVSQIFGNIAGGTGTNLIAAISGAGVITAPAAVGAGGLIGICVSGCGVGGNATIQTIGITPCVFDSGTTAGDYVQLSSSVNGNCHDTGSTIFPTVGQVMGRALSNQGGAGTYSMLLFAPEDRNTPAQFVNLTAQAANIASTPIFTPAANGFYRFSCYTVVTTAATVSSTLPQCNVLWTDADTSVSESVAAAVTNNTNTLGAIGGGSVPLPIFAKSGVAVSYSTSGYATSGATSMQYAIHIRVEGPF